MKTREDEKWQSLIALSAPTFAGDTALPYGFMTSTLARIKAEKRECDMMEKIGLRAVFASLGALAVIAVVTLSLSDTSSHGDLDPGVRTLVQMENIPVS